MNTTEAQALLPDGYELSCQHRQPKCRVWLDTPEGTRVQFFCKSWRVAVKQAVKWARERELLAKEAV